MAAAERPSIHMRPALLIIAIFAAGAPAQAAGQCNTDLAATDGQLRQALSRLEASANRPMPQRCLVFRDHVRVMQAASDTFRRCMTGFAARENIGQMQGSIADWNEIIARNCR